MNLNYICEIITTEGYVTHNVYSLISIESIIDIIRFGYYKESKYVYYIIVYRKIEYAIKSDLNICFYFIELLRVTRNDIWYNHFNNLFANELTLIFYYYNLPLLFKKFVLIFYDNS